MQSVRDLCELCDRIFQIFDNLSRKHRSSPPRKNDLFGERCSIAQSVDNTTLRNIVQIDAALCALAAHHLALGRFKIYGEVATGVIVVPAVSLAG